MKHPFDYSVGRTPAQFISYVADYAHQLAQTGRPSEGRLDHRNPDIERALSRWLGLRIGGPMRCDAFGVGVLEGVRVTAADPSGGYLELALQMRAARSSPRTTEVSFGFGLAELERLDAMAAAIDLEHPGPCGAAAARLALEHLLESYGVRQDQVFRLVDDVMPFVLVAARPVCIAGQPHARLALELDVLPLDGAATPAKRTVQPMADAFELLS